MVLNPAISKLTGKLVVLASSSPRRMEILTNVGLCFEVVPSWFKETLDKTLFKVPYEYAVATATHKAMEVAKRMPVTHMKTPDIIIGADTVVAIDGTILEKPLDKQHAHQMLSRLSGKEHSVFTGVAVAVRNSNRSNSDTCSQCGENEYQIFDFYEETKVKFADLSDAMLWEYIHSGEPMDKAGGYGIQALGGMFVEYIHGDFLNVVGFPLNHFCKQLNLIYNPSTTTMDEEISSVNGKSSEKGMCARTFALTSNLPVHANDKDHKGSIDLSPLLHSKERPSTDREPNKENLQRLTELMDGFKASKVLFTASKMCVFDILHKTPGQGAEDVAQQCHSSIKGTECLLEACVCLGLVKSIEKTDQKPGYENTDLAEDFLRTDAPFSLHSYIQHSNDTLWPLLSHLEGAVQEGTSQYEKALGRVSKDVSLDGCKKRQDDKLRFMKAMHSTATISAKAVATAFDLSHYATACDLGGCTGAMAHELIKAHPGLSVTVFDLPDIVKMSDHFQPWQDGSRLSFLAGDFFKDELPNADLYVLARVLHDCPDEKLHILLDKIAKKCSPGSGLLVSEIFLDEDRRGPSRALLQALSMSGGKQRSAGEYSRILRSHGFATVQVRRTDSLLDAMLCIKD